MLSSFLLCSYKKQALLFFLSMTCPLYNQASVIREVHQRMSIQGITDKRVYPLTKFAAVHPKALSRRLPNLLAVRKGILLEGWGS